eukprot:GHVL01031080.1.p1 GENE.GHVL01031080.1~~GHVL01031080.1.p1  ORF type:complete len:250 (-),score=37.39 GHVL01031080.1:45-794(-)
MDAIKTHCYVELASVEEATKVQENLHGERWPKSHGKPLKVEFSSSLMLDRALGNIKTNDFSRKTNAEVGSPDGSTVTPDGLRNGVRTDGVRGSGSRKFKTEEKYTSPTSDGAFSSHMDIAMGGESFDNSDILADIDILFRKTQTKNAPRDVYWMPVADDVVTQRREAWHGSGKKGLSVPYTSAYRDFPLIFPRYFENMGEKAITADGTLSADIIKVLELIAPPQPSWSIKRDIKRSRSYIPNNRSTRPR